MSNLLGHIIIIITTSLYIFPFELKGLPSGLNTKIILAAISIILLIFHLAKKDRGSIDRGILSITGFAVIVSLIALISIVFNDTYDYVYVNYVISIWVWLGASYTVICLIKTIRNDITIEIVVAYLVAVCICQCIVAIIIDNYPTFKYLINSFVIQGKAENVHRLYGIGASLDTAGTRFSAALVMISYVLCRNGLSMSKFKRILWILSYLVISVIGNMVARTTTVGLVLSLVYMVALTFKSNMTVTPEMKRIWPIFFMILIVLLPIVIYCFNNIPSVNHYIRFAFEAFFNLGINGRLETDSTTKLITTMYVFPDNLRTWIIGDGYFDRIISTDPYYTGPEDIHSFYKGTDIVYLRFIFYFGILGMLAMSSFIYKAAQICWIKCKEYKPMLIMLLLTNYIIWLKIATDLFPIFALVIWVGVMQNNVIKSHNSY